MSLLALLLNASIKLLKIYLKLCLWYWRFLMTKLNFWLMIRFLWFWKIIISKSILRSTYNFTKINKITNKVSDCLSQKEKLFPLKTENRSFHNILLERTFTINFKKGYQKEFWSFSFKIHKVLPIFICYDRIFHIFPVYKICSLWQNTTDVEKFKKSICKKKIKDANNFGVHKCYYLYI